MRQQFIADWQGLQTYIWLTQLCVLRVCVGVLSAGMTSSLRSRVRPTCRCQASSGRMAGAAAAANAADTAGSKQHSAGLSLPRLTADQRQSLRQQQQQLAQV